MLRFTIPALLLWASLPTSAQVPGTIQHNGLTRQHLTYVPSSYQPGFPVPLVFVLHGFTQSNSAIMNTTGFNTVAEENGFIVVYPNGVNNGWNTSSPFPGGSTADDVGYITALTDTITAQYSIDEDRIYSTGFSAGGYMSHKLACESPRYFAAIASVSGTINEPDADACSPAFTPGVLQVHGTADLIVSYNGSFFSGLGVQEVLDLWTGFLNCSTPAVVTPINSTVERRVNAPCDGQAQVVHDRISGGGHVWPSGSAYDATNEVWAFLQGFSCGNITTGSATDERNGALIAWPNPATTHLRISGPDAPVDLVIHDALGRTVQVGTLQAGENVLDVSRLHNGLYTLRLLGGSGGVLPFVKE